ncbi:hypothetical protein [Ralstonia flatus]|uniref:hypothetical protein n=1 Tax=Ralstonia flatus TaxID=3058601 RepID=UPI0029305F27|nr:hypothetical protein [Ralstonia sp. LMG 32965]
MHRRRALRRPLTRRSRQPLPRADVERALQLLNKHIYQADRYTGMLIVLQADAKEPVVIRRQLSAQARPRADGLCARVGADFGFD